MKKILIFVAFILCLSGCDYRTEEQRSELKRNYVQRNSSLIEITFNDETHEYVDYIDGYRGSLSHWEGCRYCKKEDNYVSL